MTDRRTRLAIVPLLALLVLPACAWVNAPPTRAGEGRLALYGVQVQRATQAMLEAAVLATETGAITQATLDRLARAGQRIGEEGQRLAVALGAIDAARRSGENMAPALLTARASINLVRAVFADEVSRAPVALRASIAALDAAITAIEDSVEGPQ